MFYLTFNSLCREYTLIAEWKYPWLCLWIYYIINLIVKALHFQYRGRHVEIIRTLRPTNFFKSLRVAYNANVPVLEYWFFLMPKIARWPICFHNGKQQTPFAHCGQRHKWTQKCTRCSNNRQDIKRPQHKRTQRAAHTNVVFQTNPLCLCLKPAFSDWPELRLTGFEDRQETQEEVSTSAGPVPKQPSGSAAGSPPTPHEQFPGGGQRHGCSPSSQGHQHHGLTQQHLPEQPADSPRDGGAGQRTEYELGNGGRGVGGG